MSVSPEQMQQMLAYYKAQFPGQMAMGMGNAPAGTNKGAGDANAMSKLAMALMQRNAMQKYNQQYPQQQAAPIAQTPPPTAVPQQMPNPNPMPGP